MWKLIFLLIAIYVVYKLFANDFVKRRQAAEKEEKENQERKIAAGEMEKDPECGTWVSVEDSISVKAGDKNYYFCSYDCRDKFLKELKSGERKLPPED